MEVLFGLFLIFWKEKTDEKYGEGTSEGILRTIVTVLFIVFVIAWYNDFCSWFYFLDANSYFS